MSVEVVLGSEGGVPVVVKRGAPGSGADRLDHEAAVLARAAGPGVVAVVRHEVRPDGGRTLLLGLAGARSLAGARLAAEAAATVAAALADVVARLHDAGVVHGRIAPEHVVLGADGRPVLCGFAGGGGTGGRRPAHDDSSTGGGVLLPADDVAGLGAVLGALLGEGVGDDDGWEPIPDHRLRRRARRWTGYRRRALLNLVDQATADDPRHRPGARAFAAAVRDVVPDTAPASTAPVTQAAPVGLPVAPAPAPEATPSPAAIGAEDGGPGQRTLARRTPVRPAARTRPVIAGRWAEARARRASAASPPVAPVPPPLGPAPAPPVVPVGAGDAEPEQRTLPRRTPVGPAARTRPGVAERWAEARARQAAASAPPARGGRALTLAAAVAGAGMLTFGLASLLGPTSAPPTAAPVPVAPTPPAADSPPSPPAAGAPSTTGAPAAEAADPAPCPPVPDPAVDADGDGCPEPVTVDGGVVAVAGTRYAVGAPGDEVAVGDWDCDGEVTAAALRPGTGEVFVFTSWARPGAPVEVAAVAVVPGATDLAPGPSGDRCPGLVAVTPDGPTVVPA